MNIESLFLEKRYQQLMFMERDHLAKSLLNLIFHKSYAEQERNFGNKQTTALEYKKNYI